MRTRTCKPAFYEDAELARDLSYAARCFYKDLWSLMDRNGVVPNDPDYVKAKLFPYDAEITSARVAELIAELAAPRAEGKRAGYVARFNYDSRQYLYCKSMPKHQWFHHKESPQYPEAEAPFAARYLEAVRANWQSNEPVVLTQVESREVWWLRHRGEYIDPPPEAPASASEGTGQCQDQSQTEARPAQDKPEYDPSVLTVLTVPTVLTSNSAPPGAEALPQSQDKASPGSGEGPGPGQDQSQTEEKPLEFGDFEPLWEMFPMKLGSDKLAGLRSISAQLRDRRGLEAFRSAVVAYVVHLNKSRENCQRWQNWIGNKRDGYPWRNWVSAGKKAGQAPPQFEDRGGIPDSALETARKRANARHGRPFDSPGWPPGYDPGTGVQSAGATV